MTGPDSHKVRMQFFFPIIYGVFFSLSSVEPTIFYDLDEIYLDILRPILLMMTVLEEQQEQLKKCK